MISDSYQTTRTREAKSATQITNDSMGQSISVISNCSGAVKIGNRNSLDHVEYLFPYTGAPLKPTGCGIITKIRRGIYWDRHAKFIPTKVKIYSNHDHSAHITLKWKRIAKATFWLFLNGPFLVGTWISSMCVAHTTWFGVEMYTLARQGFPAAWRFCHTNRERHVDSREYVLRPSQANVLHWLPAIQRLLRTDIETMAVSL